MSVKTETNETLNQECSAHTPLTPTRTRRTVNGADAMTSYLIYKAQIGSEPNPRASENKLQPYTLPVWATLLVEIDTEQPQPGFDYGIRQELRIGVVECVGALSLSEGQWE